LQRERTERNSLRLLEGWGKKKKVGLKHSKCGTGGERGATSTRVGTGRGARGQQGPGPLRFSKRFLMGKKPATAKVDVLVLNAGASQTRVSKRPCKQEKGTGKESKKRLGENWPEAKKKNF